MLGRATLGTTLSILLVSTDHLIVEVRPAYRNSELGLTGIEKSGFRQNRGEATDHGLKAAHAPLSKQAMIVATGTGAKQASGTKLKAHTACNERCGQPIDEHTSFTSTFALKRRKTRVLLTYYALAHQGGRNGEQGHRAGKERAAITKNQESRAPWYLTVPQKWPR